jgi:hypothetical protein
LLEVNEEMMFFKASLSRLGEAQSDGLEAGTLQIDGGETEILRVLGDYGWWCWIKRGPRGWGGSSDGVWIRQ